ncbi:hypothetical protein [Streptomyces chartreusis]
MRLEKALVDQSFKDEVLIHCALLGRSPSAMSWWARGGVAEVGEALA